MNRKGYLEYNEECKCDQLQQQHKSISVKPEQSRNLNCSPKYLNKLLQKEC